jgi:hypothetical protein
MHSLCQVAITLHHATHHFDIKGYVDNLNKLYAKMSLEKIINATTGQAEKAPIFNNAAQIWNHYCTTITLVGFVYLQLDFRTVNVERYAALAVGVTRWLEMP